MVCNSTVYPRLPEHKCSYIRSVQISEFVRVSEAFSIEVRI